MAKMSKQIGTTFPTLGSFAVSVFIYFCVLFFLFYKIATTEEAEKYTDTPDAFMDVFVVTEEIADTIVAPKQDDKKVEEKPAEEKKIEEVKTSNKEQTPPSKPEPMPEPPKPVEPKPVPVEEPIDLKELFKSADIKPIEKTPEKPIEPVKEKVVQANKKSADKNVASSKSASDIIKGLQESDKPKAPKAGSTGKYDKFRGSVQRIINQVWVSYKSDTNNVAKVKIFIDKNGNFSYNIQSLSYDKEFNDKVKDCLERLKTMNFPEPPSGKMESMTLSMKDEITTE